MSESNEQSWFLDQGDMQGNKCTKWIITSIAFSMFAYHMLIVIRPIFNEHISSACHLGFSLALIFLTKMHKSNIIMKKFFYIVMGVLSGCLSLYIIYNYEKLLFEAGNPETLDIIVGLLLIAIVLIVVWKTFGASLPIMVLIMVIYTFWGHHIPGVMGHARMDFGFIISSFTTSFDGVYGSILIISMNMIFLFIIFGSIFEATGVSQLFLELGKILSKNLPGGAGHATLFSSGLVGMVNGVAAANVAITGSYSIPIMKKSGFTSPLAAAIESVGSTGGQLSPPVMGVAVFIMAGFLGVPYSEILFMAIIPAIGFYASAAFAIILISYRDKIGKGGEKGNKKIILNKFPIFIVPIIILLTLLFLSYSPGYAAFWAIVSQIIMSYLRKKTRPTLMNLLNNIVAGCIMGGIIGAVCGCIGIFVKAITITGVTTKVSLVVSIFGGDSLSLTLISAMVLSIFLGGPLPTVVAYVMTAFVCAPLLMDLGIKAHVAHFFVFYYGVIAGLTPPIAETVIVASNIAQCNNMKATWESTKLILPFMLIPIFTINNPIFFFEAQPVFDATISIIIAFVSVFSLTSFCQGWLFKPLRYEKIFLLLTSASGILFAIYNRMELGVLTAIFLFFVLAIHWARIKLDRRASGGILISAKNKKGSTSLNL